MSISRSLKRGLHFLAPPTYEWASYWYRYSIRHLPELRLERRIADQLGWTVAAGPFRGLRLPRSAAGFNLGFKLLGSYEVQLHEAVEQVLGAAVRHAIVIGAAEGYYAAGFAMRSPRMTLTAFEILNAERRRLQDTIRLNGLSDRVTVRGFCTPAELTSALQGSTSALVFCDCEGGEVELLDPQVIPKLRECLMLVETHEVYVPGCIALLCRRFSATHTIETIDQATDETRIAVATAAAPRLSSADIAEAVKEHRYGQVPQQWLLMIPRAS